MSEIAENPKNWRRHNQAQRDAMQSVLERVGVAGAVLVYKSKRNGDRLTLIDGEMRSQMVRGKVPALVLDVSDEEADLLLMSYDRLGATAVQDDEALKRLVEDIRSSHENMDQLFRALNTEWKEKSEDEGGLPVVEDPTYPIEPNFDESYNYVVVFTKTEREWQQLTERLPQLKKIAKGRVHSSHVYTCEEFVKAWDSR